MSNLGLGRTFLINKNTVEVKLLGERPDKCGKFHAEVKDLVSGKITSRFVTVHKVRFDGIHLTLH